MFSVISYLNSRQGFAVLKNMIKVFVSLDLFLYIVDIGDFYLPYVSFPNINFNILERQISLNSVTTLKT